MAGETDGRMDRRTDGRTDGQGDGRTKSQETDGAPLQIPSSEIGKS